MNGQRIIGIVYNKAGRAAVRLFYVLFLEIVNLNLVVVPAFGIITGEFSGFLKDASLPDFTMTWEPGIPLA